MTEKQLKARLWKNFMTNLVIEGKPGEEPIEPVNFLGSVDSYRKIFMKTELPSVPCRCGKAGCKGTCAWKKL